MSEAFDDNEQPSAHDLFGQTAREAAVDVLHAATAIYTRELIVDQLLDSVDWPREGRKLVDSSCGDGAFLGRALQRLLTLRPTISDDQVRTVLNGWEIHPHAAGEARQRLRQVLVDHGRSKASAQVLAAAMVHCADFLTSGPRIRADVIVGNPPYLRFCKVPEPLRGEYEAVLPAYASADLLHSFLERCTSMLAPDGELGLVTADRWLFSAGAARLREVVGERFGLVRAERLDAHSAFYRPKLRKAGTPPRVHPVSVVLKARCTPGVTRIGREPIYPGRASAGMAPVSAGTLADVANVHLAPWLGTPGVFVVDAATARMLPRECVVPAVDSSDIVDGRLGAPRRFAILTRPGDPPPPAVQQHLARTMPSMCARGRRAARPWLPPEPFHNFDLTQPSLLLPRIAKALGPVELPPGVLPMNHNFSIVPLGGRSLDEIARFLASREATAWVQGRAAPLEGGYYALTARLLRALPLSGAVVEQTKKAA
jgi:hypothetical protein